MVLDKIRPNDERTCMNMEKNHNSVWKTVLIVVSVLMALAVALAAIIRTERRLRRLLGKVEGYLPRKQKNTQIRVDL